VVTPVSVSLHYNNRLIEQVSACYEENSEKKNYCPSFPMHIPVSFKEHPSVSYYPILNWIITNRLMFIQAYPFKVDGGGYLSIKLERASIC